MKGKLIKIFCGVFIILTVFAMMGAGCTILKPSNLEESETRTVMYKPDVSHYSGQLTAVFGNRIYYVSGEQEKSGIYSMQFDGRDVQYEFEVPKITRFVATEDAFYFVGVDEVLDKNQQLFGLYEVDRKDRDIEEVKSDYEHFDTVIDSYISKEGIIALIETNSVGASVQPRDFLHLLGDEFNFVDEWRMYYYKEGEPYRFNLYIGEVGQYGFSSLPVVYHDESSVEFEQVSVVDLETGRQVISAFSLEMHNYVKLLYVDGDKMLFGEYDNLVFVDRETKQKEERILVDGMSSSMWLDYLFKYDDGFLAVVKHEKNNSIKLIMINTRTQETTDLKRFNSAVVFIHADNDRIIFAQGDAIKCQAISEEGIGEMIYEINMPKNIMRSNIFEIAGDWLFIHERSISAEPQKLLYRVNLDTKEVVDLR